MNQPKSSEEVTNWDRMLDYVVVGCLVATTVLASGVFALVVYFKGMGGL